MKVRSSKTVSLASISSLTFAPFQGEIGFFDFYIIPLAKKLKECGVFGVSSDEYLQYAIENRREWEMNGRDVSEAMRVKFFLNREMKPL
jgi:hypothetical protein